MGLLEQFRRPHVGCDHVDHYAHGLGQLIEEQLVDLAEWKEGGQLDNGFYFSFEQDGQNKDVAWWRFAQARSDADVVVRHVREQNRLLLECRLTDESFAEVEPVTDVLALLVGVARNQLENRRGVLFLHDVERAVVRGHERSKLGHDQLRYRL